MNRNSLKPAALSRSLRPFPRVASRLTGQPWALGRNPFGILPPMSGSQDPCEGQSESSVCLLRVSPVGKVSARCRFFLLPELLHLQADSISAATYHFEDGLTKEI